MCYHHRNHHSYAKRKHCGPQHKWEKWQAIMQGFQASFAPVNVQEFDEKYEFSIFAAGYSKEDFKLSIVDNILTVSAKSKAKEKADNVRWQRQDFFPNGFTRKFELNDKINTDQIKASYKEGVLLVTLPKKEGKETVRQNIDID